MIKIQDLIFVLAYLLILFRKNSRLATIVGLICLLAAIPPFVLKQLLFTAERLTWYGAAFFLLAIFQILKEKD